MNYDCCRICKIDCFGKIGQPQSDYNSLCPDFKRGEQPCLACMWFMKNFIECAKKVKIRPSHKMSWWAREYTILSNNLELIF